MASHRHGGHRQPAFAWPKPGKPRCCSGAFDVARGEEGVSFQGSVLIVLLLLIAATAWKGWRTSPKAQTYGPGWRWALAATTLLVAAARLTPDAGGLRWPDRAGFWQSRCTCGPCGTSPASSPPTTGGPGCGRPGACEADFCVAPGRRVRGGMCARSFVRMDRNPGRQQHPARQRVAVGFGVFMYFPTLVECGGACSWTWACIPARCCISDGRFRIEPSKHVDGGRRDRPAKTAAYVGAVALFSIWLA